MFHRDEDQYFRKLSETTNILRKNEQKKPTMAITYLHVLIVLIIGTFC